MHPSYSSNIFTSTYTQCYSTMEKEMEGKYTLLFRRRKAAGTTHELSLTASSRRQAQRKSSKLAIKKSWILPRLSPGEAMICKKHKIANLISKLNFYKLIPYPMDNLLNRSVQTGPPNVRKRRPVFPPAGRSVVLVHSPDGVSYFLPV